MVGYDKYDANLPELPEFDPSTIRCDELQLINAPRGAGKTTTMFHWMLYMGPRICLPIVFSKTEERNHFFERTCKIPPHFIFHSIRENVIRNAFTRAAVLENSPPFGYSYELHAPCHFFFEDVFDNPKDFKTPAIQSFCKNGRQYGIGGTVLSQYLALVSKDNRGQFDRYALLYDEGANRQFIHENCFGGMPWQAFNTYYDKYTPDFGCIISSKNSFRYGAPKYTHFRGDRNLVENSEYYDIQWSPHATFKQFSDYFEPRSQQQIYSADWSKTEYGLKSALPGYVPIDYSGKKR